MAFVGDEVDPVSSSRNCDSSDDEDVVREDGRDPPALALSEGEGECELLIVGVAGAGAMFLRAAYPAATPAGNVANAGTAVQRAPKKVSTTGQTDGSCEVLRVGSGVYAVACQTEVPAERANAVAERIISSLRPSRIVVLDTVKLAYTVLSGSSAGGAGGASDGGAVRTLATTWLDSETISSHRPLESPNLVTGLTAAIMTESQIGRIPAVSFLAVLGYQLDAETIGAFERAAATVAALNAAAGMTTGDELRERVVRAARDAERAAARVMGGMFM